MKIKQTLSKPINSFKGLSKSKKIIFAVVFAVVIVALVSGLKSCGKKTTSNEVSTAKVERGDVQVQITGSGTIEANEQYNITSLVTGDVTSAPFEEGDILNEGDIMYTIDSSNVNRSIEKQKNSNERTQMEYDEILKDVKKLSVTSKTTGVVTNVNVKKGDSVNNGTKVLEVSDTENMTLKINFNSDDANMLYIGANADVYLESNMGLKTSGTVSRIGSGVMTNSSGVEVKSVEIKVKNPGGIKENDRATAIVNGVACNDSGKFESASVSYVSAGVSGEVAEIYVHEGDRITYGQTVVQLTSDSLTKSLKESGISLKDAKIGLEDLYDNLDKYTIEAPITGTVISKTTKAGDKLDNQNQSTVMAVIADMSLIKFKINVDELDIAKLELGQEVDITADALENQKFTGYVDNISIVGTTADGVTTYPVTVVVNDPDGLIPGMNVDAVITVQEVKDVLTVPVSAVNRGNIVYVKDSKSAKTEKDSEQQVGKVPAGFKEVKVETGLSNSDVVEIKSGLKEGDEVKITEVKAESSNDMFGMSQGGPGGGPGGGQVGPGGGQGGPGGGGRP